MSNDVLANQAQLNPAANTPSSDNDEIDLGALLQMLLDGKWTILAFTALIAVCGGIYAWLATPIYESDVLLQVEDSGGANPFSELSEVFGSEAASETEIEVLKSRKVVGSVVDKLNLHTSVQYLRLPYIGNAQAKWEAFDSGIQPLPAHEAFEIRRLTIPESLLGKTFSVTTTETGYRLALEDVLLGRGVANQAFEFEVDGEKGVLFVADIKAPVGQEFALSRIGKAQAIAALQGRLSVAEKGKKTGVIRVSLQGPHPEKLSTILQTLGNGYVQLNVDRRSAEAQKSLEFLDQQLPTLRSQLQAAEIELNDFLSKKKLVDLTSESQSVLDQLVSVEQQLSTLELKRVELREQFKDAHPSLVALNKQEAQLRAIKKTIDKKISGLPSAQRQMLRLKREVEVNSRLYEFLLNKAQELKVVKASTTGDVFILDDALLAFKPVKPKKALIIALSVILGLMLGVFSVFVRRALNRGVSSPEELETKLGLSVYAVVPFSSREESLFTRYARKKGKRDLLAAIDGKDLAIEALRSLRTSLHFALMDAGNQNVMITGPSPGIGKSFVSANLGYLLAESGKKVVLIDADMRKGHCHEYFAGRRDNGLSEYASGAVTEVDKVIQTFPGHENLSLISTGAIPPNPSELLMSERFEGLLKILGERYDIVLIDTPPIMAVTDAAIVMPHCGASFMVVRSGQNPLAEVEQAGKRLSKSGGKLSGVLFNGVQRSDSSSYAYGQYKYYQYEYK